jgi:hypothetical protein
VGRPRRFRRSPGTGRAESAANGGTRYASGHMSASLLRCRQSAVSADGNWHSGCGALFNRLPSKENAATCPSRVATFCVRRGSPRRRRRAVLIKPDSGQGSRGAPFGVHSPAIRAPASYRLAALAGPSAACPCSLAAMTARLPHRRDDPQPFCLTHAITGRASTSRRCTYTFLRAVLPATRNLPKRGPRRLTCWRGGAAWGTAQTSHCHKYGAFKVGAHE